MRRVVVGGVPVVMAVSVAMPVPMMVMPAAAQQPYAGDVHGQAEHCDGDGLGELDRNGGEQARHRLVADQQRDHRQHDRAGEPGEVAELASPEREAGIVRVLAGVAVGQGRQQQGAGMGAHVHPVRDQCDGAEQQAAHDLQHHHGAAERDDPPGPALRLLVPVAEEDVAVPGIDPRRVEGRGGLRDAVHAGLLLQVGADDVEQLLGRLHVERPGMRVRVHQVRADVVLDHFGHQAGQGAADAGDELHDLLAAGLVLQRALDGLHLALHAAHAGQQLRLLADGVGHARRLA